MLLIIFISFIISFFSFFFYATYLKKNKLFVDDYSLIKTKTKKALTGSGIIFVIPFIFSIIFHYTLIDKFILPNKFYLFFLSLFTMTIVSFIDDLKNLDVAFRLIVQILLTYICLPLFTNHFTGFHLENYKIVVLAIVVFWVYNINYINFYDGVDGHLTINSIFIFLSVIICSSYLKDLYIERLIAIYSLPILIAFLFYNKPIAKLYMGDAGSIFLGFLIGYLSISIFLKGYWNLAFSIIIIPFFDCTITLIRKTLKGHPPWKRLFDYFFLIPIKSGYSTNKFLIVVGIFNLINLILIFTQIYFDKTLLIFLNIINTLVLLSLFNYQMKKKK